MIDSVKSLEVRHWLHALRSSYMYHCYKLTHCASIIFCSILFSYLGNSNPGHFLKCSRGGGMGKGCGITRRFHGCIVDTNDSKSMRNCMLMIGNKRQINRLSVIMNWQRLTWQTTNIRLIPLSNKSTCNLSKHGFAFQLDHKAL